MSRGRRRDVGATSARHGDKSSVKCLILGRNLPWQRHTDDGKIDRTATGRRDVEEVENVEINLMMKKSGRSFCPGTCSGWDTCTVFSGGAGIRSDFR